MIPALRMASPSLPDHARGEQGGDVVAHVHRRADLDDVHSDDARLVHDPPDCGEDLTARQTTWLRRTGARRESRVHDVDVDREEQEVGAVHGLVDARSRTRSKP